VIFGETLEYKAINAHVKRQSVVHIVDGDEYTQTLASKCGTRATSQGLVRSWYRKVIRTTIGCTSQCGHGILVLFIAQGAALSLAA
jgi:hypothetical protein